MDHSVVASRSDCNTSVLEFPGVSFTFVAKRIVFSGDDERRRQTLEFLVARSERRHVRTVAASSHRAHIGPSRAGQFECLSLHSAFALLLVESRR